ncbi:MAG: hypothetical protein U0031_05385 [Thermomicrobiales bacterium]
MNSRTVAFSSKASPREDWLRAGVLAGFLATFAMSVVLVAAYWLANAIGSGSGNALQRWSWTLVHNPLVDRTGETVVLAIGANLAVGLCFALLYARVFEPMWSGSSLSKGMRFGLIPWLLSLVVFLPLMGAGFLGLRLDAGPLPILGNLVLHLVYGAVLGVTYAEAADDWLDDTEIDHRHAASAERGAAAGVVVGLVLGAIVGWLMAPALSPLAVPAAVAIGMAFIGAALGLGVGSFVGMGRVQTR